MNLSPAHLRRYKQIATLFWKYGRSDLMKQMAVDDAFDSHELKDPPADAAVDAKADQLADDLEAMGPTYVKLGQILAGRPDLLPDPYLKALARLQDKVKPFPSEEVEQAILTELGVRVSKAFSEFEMASKRMGQQTTQGGLMTSLLEAKDFATHLPARLNRIMDAVANAELEVKVRSTDAKMVVEGIEKIANRIAHSLLLTALIIAGALMTRVDTPFKLFGYPGFAMICFLLAAGGACILVFHMATQDRKKRKGAPRA